MRNVRVIKFVFVLIDRSLILASLVICELVTK